MHHPSHRSRGSFIVSLAVLVTLFSLLATSASALQGAAGPRIESSPPSQILDTLPPAGPQAGVVGSLVELSQDAQPDLRAQAQAQVKQQKEAQILNALQRSRQDAQVARLSQGYEQSHARQLIQQGNAAAASRQVGAASLPAAAAQPVDQLDRKPEGKPESELNSLAPIYHTTLQIVHRNTNGGQSSAFYFINESPSSTANFTLDFLWPNDQNAATEVFSVPAGGKISYAMQDSPYLPGVFAGKVVISSDQPHSAAIFTPDYGMISGRVLEPDGVTPVSGVYVNTRNWPGNNQDFGGVNSLSDGNYYIGGLPDGSYLAAVSPGYPWARQWYDNQPSNQAADEITILSAADQAGIDFILQPGGKIEGTVYAADGLTPLANINVDLEQGDYGTCSDAAGHYLIQGVPYGEHKVVAGRDWNWCTGQPSSYIAEYYNQVYDTDQATPIPINSGQDSAAGIDFTMETGGSISGKVVVAVTGAPLENITVHVRDYDERNADRNVSTAADGTFTVNGLLDGDYLVVAEDYNEDGVMWAKEFYPDADNRNDAGRVTLSGENQLTGIDFTLDPGGSIAGRILDTKTGLPLANINVDLEQGWWGTCTDADGYYYIPSVHFGGQYVVAARDWNWCLGEPNHYIQEYYDNAYWFNQADPVSVSAGAPVVDGIDFSLETGGAISGRVTDEGGNPLANIQINLNPYDANDWGRGAQTQADGSYTIYGLPDGDYRLEARDNDLSAPYYAREWYDDTYRWDQAQRVTISGSSHPLGIDFALAEGGMIQGHIYDQVSGDPLPDVCLDANRLDGNANDGACTDGQGYYAVVGLPYGDYRVAAGGDRQWAGENDYAQEYYKDALYPWDAAPAQISSTAQVASAIDFTLEHGGFISGHVQNESGAPVANLRIAAQVPQPWCQDCTEWMTATNTDANGNYTLGPLPPLEVAVYACVDCNGGAPLYYNEYYSDAISFAASTRLDVVPLNTLTGIDFILNQGWLISGDVSVPDGYAKGDLQVDIGRNDGPWYNTGARTDASGHYQAAVPQLSGHDWALRVIPRNTDLGGGRVEHVDFVAQKTWDFNLLPGGSISGRVLSNGVPLSGVNVNAWSVWFGEGVQTDSNGDFTIHNLPAGDYELNADRQPDYAWQPYHGYPWGDFRRITLDTGQDKAGFEFEILPAGRLEGHVYEADGLTPVENAWVVAIRDTSYWMAWTNSQGYYTFDVPAGEHVLYFGRDDYQVYNPVYYPGVEKFSNATPVNVPLQSAGSLVIDMSLDRYATLSGQATDSATGEPLGGIHVAALNVDPAVGLELNNSACTDQNGYYSLSNLTAGLTRVYAIGTCGNDRYAKSTRELTLLPGADHTLNLALVSSAPQPHRFTLWTYNSMDYTPLTYGGNTYDGNTAEILPVLFAPLVALDDQNQWYSDLLLQAPTVENGDARVVNNQLEVTYHFKSGLLWSDGAPLTASDLRFTWQFSMRPNPFTDQGWQSTMPLFEIESIDVPSPTVAVVKYRAGSFPPVYPLAIAYLLPEHILASADKIDTTIVSSYAHKPVGNGPYVVEDWVPGSHLDLRANPNYVLRSQGLPRIESLRIQLTGDPSDQLLRGLVDVVADGDPNLDLAGTGLALHQQPGNGFWAMFINNELPFFQETAVRQALYQALDRQRFIDLYSGAGWILSDNYLSPQHPMAGSNITHYTYNLSAAAAALDAAGWSDHDGDGIRDKNGVKLAFDIGYVENRPWRQDLAAIFHEDLAKIGVHTQLLGMDQQTFTEKMRRGELGAAPQGWFYDTPYDPMLYNLFHSRSIPGPYNGYYPMWLNARWNDPTNDALLAAARSELNRAALEDLYDQQQSWMTGQAAIYPVFDMTRNLQASNTLVGLKRSGMLPAAWNIQEWYLPPNPYDLSLRKTLSVNSPAAQPGATIEYSLQVTNLGYFAVSGALLSDTLPANLTYVSASPAPSQVNGRTIQWDLGGLAPNQVAGPFLLRAQVAASAKHGDVIQNNAQVALLNETDTHPENNGILHSLTVRQDVDMRVEKYGVGQSAVGEQYEYYINYNNLGGAPASNVTVTDALPPEVNLLEAIPAPDTIAGNTLTWNLASLGGGQWGDQIKIKTEIDAAGSVTNLADVASSDADVNPANNHAEAAQTVAAILPPVILRPTSGVTDGTPTVSGTAPASATVRIYDLSGGGSPQGAEALHPSAAPLLGVTTADASGHFQIELNLAEGGYILSATAEKSGLTSGNSNSAAITVDHDLPLDPDQLLVTADGVDLSAGCVQAERRVLPYQALSVSAVIECPEAPTAHLRVVENGQFTYNTPPFQMTNLGGAWKLDFHVYLGDAHSTYQVFLEWECQGEAHSVLLLYILVDPDGFVYDQAMVAAGVPMEEALIINATVAIYEKSGDAWQIWPASIYAQTNPQATDGATPDGVLTPGYYSFLTPSGQYRIEASAPGYLPYQSPVLTVITAPVHLDIPMTPLTPGEEVAVAPANLGGSALEVDKGSVYVGQELTYDLVLINSGQLESSPLTVDDPIPDGTSYVSNSLKWDGGGTASYNSAQNKIVWQGSLPAGGKVHLNFRVKVGWLLPAGTVITNHALPSGSPADLASLPDLTAMTDVLRLDLFLPVVGR